MHAARHGWDVEKDAPLFRNWAIHTGKHQPGVDKPDPKTWKANFRCAMNSLPDIEEVKDRSIKKGNNAFRVYRMLPLSERPSKKGRAVYGLKHRSVSVTVPFWSFHFCLSVPFKGRILVHSTGDHSAFTGLGEMTFKAPKADKTPLEF